MPEMKQFCGQYLQVHRRALLVCVEKQKSRAMKDTVFLDNLRCDGSFHDGCKKDCTIMWKEGWLKKVKKDEVIPADQNTDVSPVTVDFPIKQGDRYFCQSSEIQHAAFEVGIISKIFQFMKELIYRNQKPLEFFKNTIVFVILKLTWYKRSISCKMIAGNMIKTPAASFALKVGERVRVKSAEEIKKTLDAQGCNRGLSFTPDMYHFCGQEFIVKERLNKMILENSGKMVEVYNTVLLENVVCVGRCKYSCVRNLYHFWREIWLERVVTPV